MKPHRDHSSGAGPSAGPPQAGPRPHGRPAAVLGGRGAPSLGVDLGGTKIEALLLEADGQPRWRERIATPQGDYRATLAAVAALVARAERETGLAVPRIGVGTPGSTTAAGLIRNANSTCLNGQPLQRDLQALLARPVRLANDANCLALSEAVDGAGAGAEVVFAAILGTGVGGGWVVHGKLLAGANGLAGEWGHNPLPGAEIDGGRAVACYCGRTGCVETWLSGPGLARDHAAHGGEALTALQISRASMAGDAACTASLERYEARLARALATVINVVDPDVIVLGGGLSQIERLYAEVPRLWAQHVFSAGAGQPLRTRLAKSLHGDSSGVRGAAWLWKVAERQRSPSRAAPTLVAAVAADAKVIHGIQMRAFAEEGRLSDNLRIPPLTEDVAAIELHIRTQTVLTARDGERIVGAARGIVEGSVCTLRAVCVEPACQGRGIGAALVRAIERAHPNAERFELTTNTLVPGNVSFYERHGYHITALTPYTDKIVLAQMRKVNIANYSAKYSAKDSAKDGSNDAPA